MSQRSAISGPAASSVSDDSACGHARHRGGFGRGITDPGHEGSLGSLEALWSGWLGGLAHPDSPAGGCGPGGSSQPGPLGSHRLGRSRDHLSLHPRSPAVRFAPMNLGSPSGKGSKPSKAATETKPESLKVKSGDQEITVEILRDGRARTIADENGRQRTDMAKTRPKWSWKTGSNGRPQITIKIQTTYASKAQSWQPSAYGRGTTDADKAAGNTTLGFHESCHRRDYIGYLEEHPLPTYSQDRGEQDFNTAIQSYIDDMETDSLNKTDETGTTKAEERQAEQAGRRYAP